MTKDHFQDFIHDHNLYGFDGLITVTMLDGTTHRSVWITTICALNPSQDGAFAGKPEIELFYLFDTNEYRTWSLEEIENMDCLQERYLL